MHDQLHFFTDVSAVMLFRRSKCRMLRFHKETSVVAFQLLYFGWASQPKGKCCLPESLRRHQL